MLLSLGHCADFYDVDFLVGAIYSVPYGPVVLAFFVSGVICTFYTLSVF